MFESVIESVMDRYRGTNGILGWIIFRLDVRWLRRVVSAVKNVKE